MTNSDVYREVKTWKKPIHASRTLLARNYLKLLPNLEIIGITGSVGKTLTQNAIFSVLSQKFRVVVGDENLDPTFRIPQTILASKPWHQKLILEYGVEHPHDMDHYLSLVRPKIVVVTAIAPTHTKYFKNQEGVYLEKVKLVRALAKNDIAVLNADDPYVVKMADETHAKVWWYGRKAQGLTAHSRSAPGRNFAHSGSETGSGVVKISHFSQNLKGSKFRLHYNGQKASVSTKIIGKHQLTSVYAAATVGIICNLTLKQIAKGLSTAKPPEHRLNLIVTKNTRIIDDTYNASPKAAIESVNTLLDLGKRQKKIAVFGEMKDLGKFSQEAHELVGLKIAKSKIQSLVTIGRTASTIANVAQKNGFDGEIINLDTTRDAIEKIKKIKTTNSLILVKGSRHAHLERIVYGLLGKSTQVNCYHCGELE